MGDSCEEALEDTLKYFMDLVDSYEKLYEKNLEEEDVIWSEYEDF
ncbi:hypothetical protein [Gottschalkia purinilytica]|nr:hypothetical protein [Gottschalkia purinilytica]